jgi:hypothetical protein
MVNDVPLTSLTAVTTGAVEFSKPEPVMVSTTAVFPDVSAIDGWLSEVTVGAEFTVKALANVDVPASSVIVRLYEPGTVADVEEKYADAVVEGGVASAAPVNVTPGAFVVTVTLPPSPANVPARKNSPDAPVPKDVPVVCVPLPSSPAVVLTDVTDVREVPAAPALDATANGNAAAINMAPAARAFTPCRGIRRKVFTRNPSFVIFI